jgi:beta-galactosidase
MWNDIMSNGEDAMRLSRGIGHALAAFIGLCAHAAHAQPTERVPLDRDWRLMIGDSADAAAPGFDDRAWKSIDVPNDWAIAGPFDEKARSTGSGAWLPTGVAWYRKHFRLPGNAKGKRVFVEFDGVMERSGVWINGRHVGHRPNGYASFRYELTPFLDADGDNILAVRADTSAQPASRWYAGGGIYRHVRLVLGGEMHFEQWGIAVRTANVSHAGADIAIRASVRNEMEAARHAHISVVIRTPDGRVVARGESERGPIDGPRTETREARLHIADPHLWDTADPALYRAEVTLNDAGGEVLDRQTETFGIRDARFEAATGFWLNGRNLKLKGVAIHADGGAFGMAVPLAMYERRLRGLMALGVNAIRTAHHPFAPEFLDLCDRLGLIVMDEAFDMWTVAKNPQDYHLFFTDWSSLDARDFARRDRNHPSVVIWSIGNEIHDTPYPLVAKSIVERLMKIFHEEDPTRPVTMALFRPNTTGDYQNGLADMLDVVGQNYRERELAQAHADKPSRKIIGTENSKNRDSWLPVRDNPAYAGMFLWTGVDYLGEADRAGWPVIGNPSGLVDRTDFVKPIGWERASWWAETPVVRIARRINDSVDTSALPTMTGVAMPQPKGPGALMDWSPARRDAHSEAVEVYSNAATVELFLNGRSLGSKPRNADDRARRWDVGFAPGAIRAVARDATGRTVATDELRTAGAAAAIRLVAEAPAIGSDFDSIGFVRVEVVDAKGVVVPSATNRVRIAIEGAARLAAYDNGSPTDHTLFSETERPVYGGRALAMLRGTGTGKARVRATAAGLKPASVTLSVHP